MRCSRPARARRSLPDTLYPGDYEVMPDPISGIFTPAGKTGTRVVAEWTGEGRGVARSLIRPSPTCPASS